MPNEDTSVIAQQNRLLSAEQAQGEQNSNRTYNMLAKMIWRYFSTIVANQDEGVQANEGHVA